MPPEYTFDGEPGERFTVNAPDEETAIALAHSAGRAGGTYTLVTDETAEQEDGDTED